MKFTAAILTEHNKELDIQELSINNKLSYGQVLIKMISTGICGKQIEEIKGKMGDDKYIPHLLGHEGSGTVISVGPKVKKIKNLNIVLNAVGNSVSYGYKYGYQYGYKYGYKYAYNYGYGYGYSADKE